MNLEGKREKPNILVTGTPGVGKTTLASDVSEETGLEHVNVGDFVKMHNLQDSWDEQRNAAVVDDDEVILKMQSFFNFFFFSIILACRCVGTSNGKY